MSRHDFAARLSLAHALIARGAPSLAGHVADQLAAASRDTRALHDRLAAVLPLLAPDRHWRQRLETGPSDAVRAHLLAAVLDCPAACCHLKRGGPQPAIVRLPLRRFDCGRCVRTLRRPPADEDDRCDVCGLRGVVTFHPFAVRQGPLLIVGDGCSDCADVLGIRQEASA
jgi:hypothetical protein